MFVGPPGRRRFSRSLCDQTVHRPECRCGLRPLLRGSHSREHSPASYALGDHSLPKAASAASWKQFGPRAPRGPAPPHSAKSSGPPARTGAWAAASHTMQSLGPLSRAPPHDEDLKLHPPTPIPPPPRLVLSRKTGISRLRGDAQIQIPPLAVSAESGAPHAPKEREAMSSEVGNDGRRPPPSPICSYAPPKGTFSRMISFGCPPFPGTYSGHCHP